jgi:hypothetical protein
MRPTNKVSRVLDEATRVAEGAKVLGHKDLSDSTGWNRDSHLDDAKMGRHQRWRIHQLGLDGFLL